MPRFQHQHFRSEALVTSFGPINFDSQGYIVNRDALEATDEQLLAINGVMSKDHAEPEFVPIPVSDADEGGEDPDSLIGENVEPEFDP